MRNPNRPEQFEVSGHELITTTRAVRKRLDLDTPVNPEHLGAAVSDAMQAPQGSNLMRTHFVIAVDPEKITAIGKIYREVFDDVYRSSDTGLFVRNDSDPSHAKQSKRTRDSAAHLAENFDRVPAVVVPCLTPRLQPGDSIDAKNRLATVYPTVWNFMLAARLRGIGSCWTGMTHGREAEVAEILRIDHSQVEQVCVIPMAYFTGERFKAAWRPDPEEFIHWDSW